jgi:hypothetical protein
MVSKFLGVMTAVALLGSVAVANAGQRAILTDNQLDSVTAGTSVALVEAEVVGGSATATANLSATNTSATAGSASASIAVVFTPTGIAPHEVIAVAAASAP